MKILLLLLLNSVLVAGTSTTARIKGSVFCGEEPIRARIELKDDEIIKDTLLGSFSTNVDPEKSSAQCVETSRFEITANHTEFSGSDFKLIITPKCSHDNCKDEFSINWHSVEGGSTGDGITGEFRKKLFGIDVCSHEHRDKVSKDPVGYESWLTSQQALKNPSTPAPFIPILTTNGPAPTIPSSPNPPNKSPTPSAPSITIPPVKNPVSSTPPIIKSPIPSIPSNTIPNIKNPVPSAPSTSIHPVTKNA